MTTSETTSANPSETTSGFGDGNQTRSHNLNQDKDVMLGKGNITFMEIWKLIGSWKYYFHGVMEVGKYFGIFPNRFMEMGECPNPTRLM